MNNITTLIVINEEMGDREAELGRSGDEVSQLEAVGHSTAMTCRRERRQAGKNSAYCKTSI